MSIINQTLRALDARQTDRASRRTPPPPPVWAKRSRTRLWGSVALLSSLAGLAIWLAAERRQPPPVESERHVAMQSVAVSAPMPHASPAVPPTQISVKTSATPVVAEHQAGPVDEKKDKRRPGSDPPPKLPGPAVAVATVDVSDHAVAQQPVIRKEASQSTPREAADERYRKALTLIRAGQADRARALLEEALALSPEHVAARETLAALLSNAGRDQEAEKVLRIGRAVSPEHAWFALSLARLQAARGDTEGAVASLQSGMGGHGVDADYHATLAALLVQLKQYPDAVRQYEQALKMQPGPGTWWVGLGLALAAQGKNDEARSAYRRARMAGNLPDTLEEFVRAKLAD
ncbi:tetratricopeptide repeat protein [Thiobacillus sp.]|uniref:tetratricopeptide repeat protein n=1 Tax=Thiobacillus sp. TaxID=924 RepID=UPI0011DADFC2|nr:tetratricopeptide repeat protein [Thiobacillus sp.]TXH73073.1 MAG: tetratricopeptide repeat protein [Thiobacillus sp.]